MDDKTLTDKVTNLERARREAKRRLDEEQRASIKTPKLIGFSLEEILNHDFPRRRVVLARGEHALLRAGNIAQVFAYRGVGKTWFLETLALVAAYQVQALGLQAPQPSRVLYVDGEMASEDVKRRFEILCDMMKVPRQLGLLADRRLVIVGADWQEEYLPRLDTLEGQVAVEPFVEAAELVLIDNRSSLFDPEGEKDPTAWQPAQEWLLSLRRRGKTTVTAHHANRLGGARGLSKAEDVIDLNLKLSRPDDYVADQGARFLVEFDKARGIHGPAAAPFTASLGSRGWGIESTGGEDATVERKIREYLLASAAVGEAPKTPSELVSKAKVNRNKGFMVVAKWNNEGLIAVENGRFVYRGSYGIGRPSPAVSAMAPDEEDSDGS